MEVLQDKMVCCDSDLISDMERWHKQKRSDFRQLFVQMADRQITYYQKVRTSSVDSFVYTTWYACQFTKKISFFYIDSKVGKKIFFT